MIISALEIEENTNCSEVIGSAGDSFKLNKSKIYTYPFILDILHAFGYFFFVIVRHVITLVL